MSDEYDKKWKDLYYTIRSDEYVSALASLERRVSEVEKKLASDIGYTMQDAVDGDVKLARSIAALEQKAQGGEPRGSCANCAASKRDPWLEHGCSPRYDHLVAGEECNDYEPIEAADRSGTRPEPSGDVPPTGTPLTPGQSGAAATSREGERKPRGVCVGCRHARTDGRCGLAPEMWANALACSACKPAPSASETETQIGVDWAKPGTERTVLVPVPTPQASEEAETKEIPMNEIEEYEALRRDGLSDDEARGTVWPDGDRINAIKAAETFAHGVAAATHRGAMSGAPTPGYMGEAIALVLAHDRRIASEARGKAIEEAAVLVEAHPAVFYPDGAHDVAKAIRALSSSTSEGGGR